MGWELSEIGNEVEAVGGATPSTKEPAFWEGGEHHWATPKDLSKLASPVLLDTDRKITDAGVKKISSGLLPVGTVLLSSRAPIGYLAIAEVPTAVNQGFIAMVCRRRLPDVFVLFWCYENLDYIKGISGGSTFAEISKKAFRPVPVVVPSEQILTAYERIVRPLYDQIVANTTESAGQAQQALRGPPGIAFDAHAVAAGATGVGPHAQPSPFQRIQPAGMLKKVDRGHDLRQSFSAWRCVVSVPFWRKPMWKCGQRLDKASTFRGIWRRIRGKNPPGRARGMPVCGTMAEFTKSLVQLRKVSPDLSR